MKREFCPPKRGLLLLNKPPALVFENKPPPAAGALKRLPLENTDEPPVAAAVDAGNLKPNIELEVEVLAGAPKRDVDPAVP